MATSIESQQSRSESEDEQHPHADKECCPQHEDEHQYRAAFGSGVAERDGERANRVWHEISLIDDGCGSANLPKGH
jgi:hypothetical protein